jgi:hypothetical protein
MSNPLINSKIVHAKAHTHIKHKKSIALSIKRAGSLTFPRPEPLESNQQEHDGREIKKQVKLLGSFTRFIYKTS